MLLDSIERETNCERDLTDTTLERMLRDSFEEEITFVEFSRQSGDFLGPPCYPIEVVESLDEFKSELFVSTLPSLQANGTAEVVESMEELWGRWRQRARRGNHELDRQIVDILSYESKTALHRCYSWFWSLAAQWLTRIEHQSQNSTVFHEFWNTDLTWPSIEFENRSCHLFHGHVFALHPGTFSFMRTETGQRMMEEWLDATSFGWQHEENPESPELRRLLHGIYVSMVDYASRVNLTRELRRGTALELPKL